MMMMNPFDPTHAVLSDGIKVIQINLNHCWAAQQLLLQTMAELQSSIAIISDYYRPMGGDERWFNSVDGKSAIFVTGNSCPTITHHGAGPGFVWVRIDNLVLYSCYCSPNCTLQEFDAFLGGLEASIRLQPCRQVNLVVAGDLNAHSAEWGSARQGARGSLLSDFVSSLGMVVSNRGSVPTYRRVNASSVVDVTFAKSLPNNHPLVKDWKALEHVYSASDHVYISYAIALPERRTNNNPVRVAVAGWSIKKLNPALLDLHWGLVLPPLPPSTGASADCHADSLNSFLTEACKAAMPPRAALTGKKSVHWWNAEIAELRRIAIAALRRYQRAGRRSGAPLRVAEREAYNTARMNIKKAIRQAQEKSWHELCLAVNNDPWGVPYRLVTKRLGRRAPAMDLVTVSNVAHGLFPSPPATDWVHIPLSIQQSSVLIDLSDCAPMAPPITAHEVKCAVDRLPSGKAPGPDQVPNEIIKLAFAKFPERFINCYNACLTNRTFPSRWKCAKLVLLHKGQGKARDLPSSYRPISLLDGAGKVFERVLLNRLEAHITRVGAISDSQFGFRRSKSTTDAIEEVMKTAHEANHGPVRARKLCVLITLDVRNAFNSAPWRLIDEALRKSVVPKYLVEIMRSYMQARNLKITDDINMGVTCGVPQGSVLGPTLWNLFYDGVLRIPMRDGAKLIAFADDVAVVVTAFNAELVEQIANPTLEDIAAWMTTNGLQLAPEKSECVVLTNKKKFRNPDLFIHGHQIPSKRAIRYLGVQLDTRLSFIEHASTVAVGARKAVAALGRLMPNVGGPTQAKRQLLMSVVHSRLLYGAAIWSEEVSRFQKSSNVMLQAQRCAALRVARCYRTVSDMAALVLAKMPPATLLAGVRKQIAAAKKAGAALSKRDMMADVLRRWQNLWDSTGKAAWTKRLIPNLSRWWQCGPREVSYHMSQALSGHGCYQNYLWTRNKAPSPACPHCTAEVDDAEHTVFVCFFWSEERKEVEQSLGRPVRPEDAMDLLCGPSAAELPTEVPLRGRILAAAEKRKVQFAQMVEVIMGRKEELERARQREAAVE
ncbi:unnamed protein product [Macrosiphum euphorbiae]|uniref:Reverse transcriptase domain-containing protein n=1 Tax=Macrosiphum euphorbiae TaxID=13131 RepID=A0AAV0X581_9HEMI|nr:unnamed protein product [Macrosiphum euphorbiae]